jgi:tRNA (cmo5U34)-methyltransferase
MDKPWSFDQNIAGIFTDHARKHIPDYDRVIDKSIEVCEKFLHKDSAIIDVGCATGETLKRLKHKGYRNLTGVDNSQSMLDQCHVNAKLICDDQFPDQTFDAVLCNWTLHFMPNKLEYLQQIYDNLSPKGFIIVTDKTSMDPVMIDFYHDYKAKAGVSQEEIKQKAQSVKSIMYIDTPQWYLENLKRVGFTLPQIIDANWCFTTFLAIK